MHYTPTEQRIIDLLSDGLPHDREDVRVNCFQKNTSFHTIAVTLLNLRPKLRAMGQEIVTEHWRGSIAYRHVVLLSGTQVCNDPV